MLCKSLAKLFSTRKKGLFFIQENQYLQKTVPLKVMMDI